MKMSLVYTGYASPENTLGNPERLPYRKRLEIEANELEKRANDIREVIKFFDANPEIEKVLDAMRRLGV